MKDYIEFKQHPDIDILFGSMNHTIPSKKEDFKPILVREVNEDGVEKILNDFYLKKPSSQSVKDFENLTRQNILSANLNSKKFNMPSLVEVVITISIIKSNFFNIDLDNIAKTVLDSLKGLLFDDDSQVVNLIVKKDIHPNNTPGYFIAVTELKEGRNGLMGDLYLFSTKNS